MKTLTRRQLELLYLKDVPIPDTQFRVLDLSQNLQFCCLTSDKMPCVTPAGEKFLTQQVRFVTGKEYMQFMGIYFDEPKLEKYSSSTLQDLAGNAFETSSCAANMLCNMLFLAANHQCKQFLSQVSRSPALAWEVSDFEPELDDESL